jgi:mono/diheme cytochrome c family protein
MFFDTAVVQDEDLIVRLAAFNKMVQFEDKETIALAAKTLITDSANADDMWLSQSLRNAGAGTVKKGPATFGKELIVNGSFENVVGDMPVRWTERAYRGTAQHRVANIAHTGKRSIEISADKAAEYGVYFKVPVEKHSEYELSVWIKTENVAGGGRGAMLYIGGNDTPGSKSVKGTKDWTQVTMRLKSGLDTSMNITCLFGGWGIVTGKAWWDDVSLRKVTYEVIESDESEAVAKGNVERGKKIFMTHPIAACTRCHVVNGVGGPVGPALDTIATRKQEDYILQSLVDPGATIAEGYVGKVSPMPPMGVLLKPQELADVMAYILTLK